MNRRCAGLVVVLMSLAAFGVGNAQQDVYGVIDPNTHTVWVDTAILQFPVMPIKVATPDWGSAPGALDTFYFGDFASWPTGIQTRGTVDGNPNASMFPSPVADTWYAFMGVTPPTPMAMFYGEVGVEESRSATRPRQCLNVSPSVVTSQMTVRVEAAGNAMVEVLDAVGNLVRTLNCTDGAATWSREDGLGRLVPEGVYFCRYATSGEVAVRKVLVTH